MGQRARGSCATERELKIRDHGKNPTLTSKSATLGWGTLEISAGDQGLGSPDAFAWATRRAGRVVRQERPDRFVSGHDFTGC
jgi:hypothetical protein